MKTILLAMAVGLLLPTQSHSQNKRVYPPQIKGAEEYVYKEASGSKLKLWAFNPADWKPSDSRPAIVFFFGGGWKSGSPGQFVPQL